LAAAVDTSESQTEGVARVEKLQQWLKTSKGMQPSTLEAKRFKADEGERIGWIASGDIQKGQVVLEIPEEVAITSIDAEKHPLVGEVAAECSELIALTLWLMAERAAGSASSWAQLLHTLPQSTESPILWDDQERAELLRGSPLLDEARQRQATLQQQWSQLSEKWFNASPDKFSPTVFNESNFLRSFCVVLGHAQYLPSASCFALLPMVSLISRTGNENGCDLDYDADRKSVLLSATRPYR
jgi:histone-lysine N-methyltransferase SETD3